MAFNVRVHGYAGIQQIPQSLVTQHTENAVFVYQEPYIFGEIVSCSAVAASSTPNSDATTKFLRIEVPDGAAIRYEVNLNGPGASNVRTAQNVSPRGEGVFIIPFGPGASLSIVDASGLP